MKKYFLILLMIPLLTTPNVHAAPKQSTRYAVYVGATLLTGASLVKLISLLRKSRNEGDLVKACEQMSTDQKRRKKLFIIASICGISVGTLINAYTGYMHWKYNQAIDADKKKLIETQQHSEGEKVLWSTPAIPNKGNPVTPDATPKEEKNDGAVSHTELRTPAKTLIFPDSDTIAVTILPQKEEPEMNASFSDTASAHTTTFPTTTTPFSEPSSPFTPLLPDLIGDQSTNPFTPSDHRAENTNSQTPPKAGNSPRILNSSLYEDGSPIESSFATPSSVIPLNFYALVDAIRGSVACLQEDHAKNAQSSRNRSLSESAAVSHNTNITTELSPAQKKAKADLDAFLRSKRNKPHDSMASDGLNMSNYLPI